ncbi:MAG: DUF362 domain-containing protein [Armatimonadetes bacterium]|nr:DUF362 domain-containing protein [Armatimonadota bacterium]
MKWVIIALFIFLLLYSSQSSYVKGESTVYFTRDISSEAVLKIFEKISDNVIGKVAIKIHFGEERNQNYIQPELIRKLTEKLKATLVESNVLYRSKRRFTEYHVQLAKDHGFDFAPIDILDSEGEKEIQVDLNHYKKISVGKHLDLYDNYVIISHFKGHSLAGFGGAIKNVAMGLSSIPGKMSMHASTIPVYDPARCSSCKVCTTLCPVEAITLEPLVIDTDKCIGCGKCVGICPTYAIQVPWESTEKNVFNERLAEYAKGISDNYNMVYINVLVNISKDCDCDAYAHPPFMEDIGILASTDIVAIEKASLDLVNKAFNCEDTFLKVNNASGNNQIEYAFEIGLGNKEYLIFDIDKED